mmetsp:Transcript_13471/g.26465  ORF Transcript_13471/g.26465 Transcript_13471/m.26465 type:complete len:326 (-) Transcript_13471:112-1089(-)
MVLATDPFDSDADLLHWALAESIEAALHDGTSFKDSETSGLLREAFLAESEDESEAAAARCAQLRRGLAAALHTACAARGALNPLLVKPRRGTCPPPVRIEVRNTAGRCMTQGSFAVGSHPYCDVQVFGDATVQPLHCVVVSLPGGIAVVDAWSRGGTERVSDQYDGPTPALREGSACAFTLPHGQRATLRIGATVIALGPPRPRAPKRGTAAPLTSKVMARPRASTPQAAPKKPAAKLPSSALGSLAWLNAAERDKASRSTGCSSALDAASPLLSSSTSQSTCGAASRSTSSSSSGPSRTMSRSRSPRRPPFGQHQEECVAMGS